MNQLSPVPDLTVVVELTTADITGSCDASVNLLAWAREAAAVAPMRAELLCVGPRAVSGLAELNAPVPVHFLQVPGAGYYGLKNAGANAAKGRIVLFTDADCRPSPGYVTHLFRAFDDPTVACAASRCVYDGSSFLTRLNSVLSFGELLRGQQALDNGGMVLADAVAVRRSLYTRDPFGPFGGRVGGDRYITELVRRQGGRLLLVDDISVHHEDMSYSVRGTLERHLRENIVPLGYGAETQRVSTPFALLCVLLLRPALRLRRVLRSGPYLGIRPIHFPLVAPILLAYWLLALVAVPSVLLVAPWRRRWLRFQFG